MEKFKKFVSERYRGSYGNRSAYRADGGANDEGWKKVNGKWVDTTDTDTRPVHYAIQIDGKYWRKGGKIVTFKDERHARNVARKLNDKSGEMKALAYMIRGNLDNIKEHMELQGEILEYIESYISENNL